MGGTRIVGTKEKGGRFEAPVSAVQRCLSLQTMVWVGLADWQTTYVTVHPVRFSFRPGPSFPKQLR